jgi:3',5'-cyclic AMP phosphodiesterase CpdA
MDRVAWLTDIHLNFLWEAELNAFCDLVRGSNADALLFGGDIAEAVDIERLMARVADAVGIPIYFVLGNHDYYKGSIEEVREQMRTITHRHPLLRWLPAHGIVELSPTTVLLGHGGWGDGRCGDYANSTVMLNDYRLIKELSGLDPQARLERLHALGDEAADFLGPMLTTALAKAPNVLLLTHVPPFRESCWHEGEISDDNWLPHFTCKAVGEALAGVMKSHPDRNLTVLCGHTHSAGEVAVLPNLVVKTGKAEYGTPEINQVFSVV